jgi:hypothetical protein
MKLVLLLCVSLAVIVHKPVESKTLHRSVRAPQKYTSKYDNIDVERILHSKRLLLNYINCLLDKGSCSPDGRELKSRWFLVYISLRNIVYSPRKKIQ